MNASGNGKNKKAKKESPTDWINNMSANKVIGDAQRILKTAVDVLEEEIAAGIVAAKKLEKKVINVDEVRSTDPGELMSRVRRDVHDAVDIFLDAVTALTNHFSNLTSTVTKTQEAGITKKYETNIAVVKTDSASKAGENITLSILLTNDNPDQQMPVKLLKPDLINQKGNKILSRYIQIEPGAFVLAPSGKKEVLIKIRIPLTCKPGIYSGLLLDSQNPELRTIVTIDVQ